MSLDRSALAVGSLVVVAALLPAVGRVDGGSLAPAVPLAVGLAAVLAVPAAVVGLWRGVDADRFLTAVVGLTVAAAAVVAVAAAVAVDPGDAPAFGAVALAAGLGVWLLPLSVGATRRLPFGRLLAAWPPAALVGAAVFAVAGGPAWDGLVSGRLRLFGSLAAALLLAVGPTGLATVVDLVRGRPGGAAAGR